MIGMSVIFDGKNLTELFNEGQGRTVPVDVTKNVASNFNNNYQDQGRRRYGQQFLYSTLSVKQIQVSFTLVGNYDYFNTIAETLGGYLNVDKPKTLIFGDEPNKVWEAIPSGQASLTVDKNTAPITATVTVTFDVPKSYGENKAQALVSSDGETKYGSIKKVSTGHYKATLKNFGTAETYPDIKLKFNSDNGWVGVVKSSSESYEIGNPNEADTRTVKQSEILFDYVSNNWITNGFAVGTKNQGRFNDNLQSLNGTLAIDNAWGRPHIALTSRGSGSTLLRGGSITWEIPADSNREKGSLYEYMWWRQIFGSVHLMSVVISKYLLRTQTEHFCMAWKHSNMLTVSVVSIVFLPVMATVVIVRWIEKRFGVRIFRRKTHSMSHKGGLICNALMMKYNFITKADILNLKFPKSKGKNQQK